MCGDVCSLRPFHGAALLYALREASGQLQRQWPRVALLVGLNAALPGCRNVLGTPIPAGVIDPSALSGAAGAEVQRQGAIAAFANGFDVEYSGLITDEFTNYFLQDNPSFSGSSYFDARQADRTGVAASPGVFPFTDPVYTRLQQARASARLAAVALGGSAPASGRAGIGQMFVIVGYTELLLAEDFCSGVPLSDVVAGGGVRYGASLTTDSLLGRAAADFDSALVAGVGNDTVLNLARVGLGRALLDRGQSIGAAAAVAAVPTGFQYVVWLPATPQGTILADFYSQLALPAAQNGHVATVADREGGNGLNFVSGHDPRMPIDSSQGPTIAGTPFYYPAKFPISSAPPITLADGVEAQLIEAEATLKSGDAGGWARTLNALRADSADTHVSGLPALTLDSTTNASAAEQVDVMFRERAFWLFGTGHRLGDLRRLIRQYGRAPATVFPSGSYPATGLPPGSSAIPSYGTDVNFPIQAVEQANPAFHGCLSSGA
jgi:hypothetical protein